MVPEDDLYKNSTHIDVNDPKMVEHWAKHWGVSPLTVVCAVRKVDPLVRDVAVEIWKII